MADEKKKRTKRPTAQKRDLQNEKKRLLNKSFKSQLRSAMRDFESTLKAQDKEEAQKKLNSVYAFMDKGVKRGIFNSNKANRSKARAAAKFATLSS